MHRDATSLLITRSEVKQLLPIGECIEAVQSAFVRYARGESIPPAVLGVHVEGGGFHVKSSGLRRAIDDRLIFAAKINANFPGNRERSGLPTIQGVIALFDAANGQVLCLLDSIEITTLRTAAATAVAARYLAPEKAVVTICGCGDQARSQLRAVAHVRSIERVIAIDVDSDRSTQLAAELSPELHVEVVTAHDPLEAAADTRIWITCTPARRWFLGRAHVKPGAFVAAVGADNPEKQEIEPELLAENVVVTDNLEQCAAIGDLHHALDAGVMRREDVRAELADVITGSKLGRVREDEIIIFDSTGTALQDVAAAPLVYERAIAGGIGMRVELGK